jgi:hypothetical protein
LTLQAAEELVNELQKKMAQLVTENAEQLRKFDDLDKVRIWIIAAFLPIEWLRSPALRVACPALILRVH